MTWQWVAVLGIVAATFAAVVWAAVYLSASKGGE